MSAILCLVCTGIKYECLSKIPMRKQSDIGIYGETNYSCKYKGIYLQFLSKQQKRIYADNCIQLRLIQTYQEQHKVKFVVICTVGSYMATSTKMAA
jgi:hypothetical protein